MAGRYCEGKIEMASEKFSRKMVLEIKYVNANNAVIRNENSKLLLDLNCSPKELEKKTVVNSCGIEHSAAKRGFSDHSIELYYVDQFLLIFIKGLVSSTHILQGIFSSWNKEKLCSPGARKFSLPRASIVSPYSKRKIFPGVYECCSLGLK